MTVRNVFICFFFSVTDVDETFTMGLIGQLLTQGEKAAFYRSLIEANIGSDYAPTHG